MKKQVTLCVTILVKISPVTCKSSRTKKLKYLSSSELFPITSFCPGTLVVDLIKEKRNR